MGANIWIYWYFIFEEANMFPQEFLDLCKRIQMKLSSKHLKSK